MLISVGVEMATQTSAERERLVLLVRMNCSHFGGWEGRGGLNLLIIRDVFSLFGSEDKMIFV